jgi:hypothetical protein
MFRMNVAIALIAAAALAAAGCGSSKSSSSSPSSSAAGSSSPGALSAEAKSAATGDIPDNQMFLTFKDGPAGYTIKYPEGWTQQGSGKDVKFQDKNNVVHIVIGGGSSPTPAVVASQLKSLQAGNSTLKFKQPTTLKLGSGQGVKATYTTRSAPNPVTGKRVTLTVDRYVVAKGGKRAVVDLGTPVGVDNVDAYRMMIQSFQWK